jgi:hypothetical protein
MRILVAGDRHWHSDELAERVVQRIVKRYGSDVVIVNGGAPGVDWAFSKACRKLVVEMEVHTADFRTLRNVAGPARNREMVQAGADLCVAFHRALETSEGTKDCVGQALAAGIAVYSIADDGGQTRRVLAGDQRIK